MKTPIESITKSIFYPTPKLCIKLKVNLGTKYAHSNTRKKFIQYNTYNSQWYAGIPKLGGANVHTTEYIIIESWVTYEERQNGIRSQGVYFSYDNIPLLSWALEEAYKWVSKDSVTIFDMDEQGRVVCIKKTENAMPAIRCDSIHCKGLSNPPLQLTPVMRPDIDGGFEAAVMILMGPENSQIASLNAQELWAVCYFLNHFDLTCAAMLLVNQMLLTSPMLKDES